MTFHLSDCALPHSHKLTHSILQKKSTSMVEPLQPADSSFRWKGAGTLSKARQVPALPTLPPMPNPAKMLVFQTNQGFSPSKAHPKSIIQATKPTGSSPLAQPEFMEVKAPTLDSKQGPFRRRVHSTSRTRLQGLLLNGWHLSHNQDTTISFQRCRATANWSGMTKRSHPPTSNGLKNFEKFPGCKSVQQHQTCLPATANRPEKQWAQ